MANTRPIRAKLLLAAAFVSALVLLMQTLTYYDWYRHRRTALIVTHSTVASAFARSFSNYLSEVSKDIQTVELSQAAQVSPSVIFAVSREVHPEIRWGAVFSRDGAVLASTNSDENELASARDMMLKLGERNHIVSSFKFAGGERAYMLATRNRTSGTVVVVSLDPAGLHRVISGSEGEGRVLLFDSTGSVLLDSSRQIKVGSALVFNDGLLLDAPSRISYTRLPGSTEGWLGATAYIGDMGWHVAVLSPTSEALAPIFREMLVTLLIALGLFGVGAVFAVLLGRQITAPVTTLAAAAVRIGRGDLSTRVRIASGDELEQTGAAFNTMAENLQTSMSDLQSLQSILDVGLSTLDLHDMLQGLLSRLVSALKTDVGAMYLMEPDGKMLKMAAVHGVDEESLADIPMTTAVGVGITGKMAETGETLYIRDLHTESDILADAARRIGQRSVLGTPLWFDHKVIGLVLVGSSLTREFSPREISLLEVLADRAALAIQNRRLYDQQIKLRKREAFLAEASELFNSTLRLDEILNLIVFKCYQALGDYNVVALLNNETGRLDVAADYHPNTELLTKLHNTFSELAVAPGVGVMGASVMERKSILVSDFSGEMPESYKMIAERVGGKAALAVPLVVQDEVIGALVSAVIEEDRSLTSDELSLAVEIGGHATAAIANSRLYEQVRERASDIENLWEVGQAILADFQMETRLNSIAAGAARLVNADAAAVLLYDDARGVLTVYSRFGLDEEPEDVSYQLGEGLIGRVAKSGRPMAVRHLSEAPGVKYVELARSRGLESALFVPMVDRGRIVGLVAVYSAEPRDFDRSETRLVSTLASFSAVAIENTKLYERERAIAERLQEAFKPTRTKIDGLDLAMGYYPGSKEADIGGDFYDIIEFPDGRVGLVMADVSGKGLEAAVYTVMIKYAVRSFAAIDPSPPKVVSRTNRVVATYVPTGRFVTLVYVLLDPHTGEMQYCNAGHENPVMYSADDGLTSTLEVTGPAVGGFSLAHYEQREVSLKKGDSVVLYTDGVTDARHDGVFFDQEGLQEVVLENTQKDAHTLVDAIYHSVRDFGRGRLYDDVTVMVIRLADGNDDD